MKNLLVVSLFFVLLSSFTGSNNNLNAFEVSEIVWETDIHNFGEIPQGKPISVDFKFTNTGNTPLVITDVKTSCGCTASNYSKKTIEPGKTSSITVSYNAKKIGAFTKTVSVFTNANELAKELYISGTVVK